MKKISTKIWALIIGVVFALCAGFTASIYLRPQKNPTPPPVAESATPSVTESATPSAADTTPPVESATPSVESATPPVESETPPAVSGAPSVTDTTPPVTNTAPPVESTTPPPVESEEPSGEEEFTIVGPIALIYQYGYLMDAVDLGLVTESFTAVYPGLDGAENTVEFAYGQARMDHSTCPDQVCVGMGWQDGSFPLPIACLPNAVIVQIVSADELFEPEVDGATQ